MKYHPLSVTDASANARDFAWRRIPIIGWIVQDLFWLKRVAPMVATIEEALAKREETNPEEWGSDLRTQWIAEVVCRIAQEEIGWGNDHFIPKDPVSVVFWAHEDGLDADCAMLEIGEELKLKIETDELNEWFSLSMADLVELLKKRVDLSLGAIESQWPPPPKSIS